MEILQKEGKVYYQAVYKSNPGTMIVCRKRRAPGQEKNASSIYTVKKTKVEKEREHQTVLGKI